jgi:Kef-type K+ transport system membrane component KefB
MGQIPGFTATIFPASSMAGLQLFANVALSLFLFVVGLELDMSGAWSAAGKDGARL